MSAKYIQQLVICDKLFKSQVLKGITRTGGIQHCNSKASLGLAWKWGKTLGNLAELSYRGGQKKSAHKTPRGKKQAGNLGRNQASSSKVLPTGLSHGKRETTTWNEGWFWRLVEQAEISASPFMILYFTKWCL